MRKKDDERAPGALVPGESGKESHVTGVQARRVAVANAKEEALVRGLIEAWMSSSFTSH